MTDPRVEDLTAEQRRALLRDKLRQPKREIVETPLSPGQLGLLYVYQEAPASSAYNVSSALHIASHVDVAALRAAYAGLINRHGVMRTTIVLDRAPRMRTLPPASAPASAPEAAPSGVPTVRLIDARALSPEEVHQAVQQEYAHPFDLYAGPLHRLALFTLENGDSILVLVMHHIVSDGVSMGILIDELLALYAAALRQEPASLPPVTREYSDFVRSQRELLAGAQGEALRNYWLEQFAGEIPVLALPLDKPRPDPNPLTGDTVAFNLDAATVAHLRTLAREEHTTPFVILIAAYALLLRRYSGQDDIVISTPMLGRTRPEDRHVVGYFASPSALRIKIDPAASFHQFLQQVRKVVLGAIDHQEYPFPLLVEERRPPRLPGRLPIADVMFNLLSTQHLGKVSASLGSADSATAEAGMLALTPYPLVQEEGQFDVALYVADSPQGIYGELKYSTALFARATAERMAAHYLTLLHNAVEEHSQTIGTLTVAPPEEIAQLAAWNATSVPLPADATLHGLVAAQAARTPHASAASDQTLTLTYAELEQRAELVASQLRALQVGAGDWVGVYLNRSVHMLVALLGILKSGAGYVPLDPAFPRDRLTMMVDETAAKVILSEHALQNSLPGSSAHALLVDSLDYSAAPASEAAAEPVDPEQPAYVLFTSGSTGRPKGVVVPHRAVVNFILAMQQTPGMAASDVLGAVTTLSFDISVLELFLPLSVGAQTVILSREVASSGTRLADEIARRRITVMQATPSTWRLLLAAEFAPPPGFRGFCGGEPLPESLASALLERQIELWNLYGPTETTVWSTAWRLDSADAPIPVGRPIANTQLYLLDASQLPTPLGVPGVLHIGGAGVATGYLNRPDLTAERFVHLPRRDGTTTRVYNTGDRARFRPDGVLVLLGRDDDQVKVNGFRIEPGEIEARLESHPQVREACVVAREDGRGNKRLVAYLVAAPEADPEPGALRVYLRATLPDYMIPSAFFTLAAMPRTPNGKIDRKALPAPEAINAVAAQNWVAPGTPTEVRVAQIWQEVIAVPKLGLHDNFFDIGGNSLNAMEIIAICEKEFGVAIHPGLFRAQSLGQLARMLDESAPTRNGAANPSATNASASGAGAPDTSPAQLAPVAQDADPEQAQQGEAHPEPANREQTPAERDTRFGGRLRDAARRALGRDHHN